MRGPGGRACQGKDVACLLSFGVKKKASITETGKDGEDNSWRHTGKSFWVSFKVRRDQHGIVIPSRICVKNIWVGGLGWARGAKRLTH